MRRVAAQRHRREDRRRHPRRILLPQTKAIPDAFAPRRLLKSCPPPKKLACLAILNGSIIAQKNRLLFCHVQSIIVVTVQHRQDAARKS